MTTKPDIPVRVLTSPTDTPALKPPTRPTIHIYAELHLHISSATLYASLTPPSSSPSQTQTTARLRIDGSTLTLTHLSSSASITLPARPIGDAEATIHIPPGRAKEVTSRLQIDGGNVAELLTLQNESLGVPWSAGRFNGLEAGMEVECAVCGAVVVERGRVKEWMDLPSRDWAEMMDLWCCHKPSDHGAASRTHTHEHEHEHEHVSARGQEGKEGKGKAEHAQNQAGSKEIGARPGAGLVDPDCFLLHASDCRNSKVQSHPTSNRNLTSTSTPLSPSSPSTSRTSTIQCTKCGSELGRSDSALEDAYRIWKASVAISLPSPTTHKNDHEHEVKGKSSPQSTAADTQAHSEQNGMKRTPKQDEDEAHNGDRRKKMTFPPEKWALSFLISALEDGGVGNKFLVLDSRAVPSHTRAEGMDGSVKESADAVEGERSEGLKKGRVYEMWLFTPDLYICSSRVTSAGVNSQNRDGREDGGGVEGLHADSQSGGDMSERSIHGLTTRAAKILYRPLHSLSARNRGERRDGAGSAGANGEKTRHENEQSRAGHGTANGQENGGRVAQEDEEEEVLEMPEILTTALFDALERNAPLLPSSMRTWKGWDVSLLRRFGMGDLEV